MLKVFLNVAGHLNRLTWIFWYVYLYLKCYRWNVENLVRFITIISRVGECVVGAKTRPPCIKSKPYYLKRNNTLKVRMLPQISFLRNVVLKRESPCPCFGYYLHTFSMNLVAIVCQTNVFSNCLFKTGKTD